jgi:hypothetical protein
MAAPADGTVTSADHPSDSKLLSQVVNCVTMAEPIPGG